MQRNSRLRNSRSTSPFTHQNKRQRFIHRLTSRNITTSLNTPTILTDRLHHHLRQTRSLSTESSQSQPTFRKALSSFVLKIHPDFFESAPETRDANSKALGALNAVLTDAKENALDSKAIRLQFFLRDPSTSSSIEDSNSKENQTMFKKINFTLQVPSIRPDKGGISDAIMKSHPKTKKRSKKNKSSEKESKSLPTASPTHEHNELIRTLLSLFKTSGVDLGPTPPSDCYEVLYGFESTHTFAESASLHAKTAREAPTPHYAQQFYGNAEDYGPKPSNIDFGYFHGEFDPHPRPVTSGLSKENPTDDSHSFASGRFGFSGKFVDKDDLGHIHHHILHIHSEYHRNHVFDFSEDMTLIEYVESVREHARYAAMASRIVPRASTLETHLRYRGFKLLFQRHNVPVDLNPSNTLHARAIEQFVETLRITPHLTHLTSPSQWQEAMQHIPNTIEEYHEQEAREREQPPTAHNTQYNSPQYTNTEKPKKPQMYAPERPVHETQLDPDSELAGMVNPYEKYEGLHHRVPVTEEVRLVGEDLVAQMHKMYRDHPSVRIHSMVASEDNEFMVQWQLKEIEEMNKIKAFYESGGALGQIDPEEDNKYTLNWRGQRIPRPKFITPSVAPKTVISNEQLMIIEKSNMPHDPEDLSILHKNPNLHNETMLRPYGEWDFKSIVEYSRVMEKMEAINIGAGARYKSRHRSPLHDPFLTRQAEDPWEKFKEHFSGGATAPIELPHFKTIKEIRAFRKSGGFIEYNRALTEYMKTVEKLTKGVTRFNDNYSKAAQRNIELYIAENRRVRSIAQPFAAPRLPIFQKGHDSDIMHVEELTGMIVDPMKLWELQYGDERHLKRQALEKIEMQKNAEEIAKEHAKRQKRSKIMQRMEDEKASVAEMKFVQMREAEDAEYQKMYREQLEYAEEVIKQQNETYFGPTSTSQDPQSPESLGSTASKHVNSQSEHSPDPIQTESKKHTLHASDNISEDKQPLPTSGFFADLHRKMQQEYDEYGTSINQLFDHSDLEGAHQSNIKTSKSTELTQNHSRSSLLDHIIVFCENAQESHIDSNGRIVLSLYTSQPALPDDKEAVENAKSSKSNREHEQKGEKDDSYIKRKARSLLKRRRLSTTLDWSIFLQQPDLLPRAERQKELNTARSLQLDEFLAKFTNLYHVFPEEELNQQDYAHFIDNLQNHYWMIAAPLNRLLQQYGNEHGYLHTPKTTIGVGDDDKEAPKFKKVIFRVHNHHYSHPLHHYNHILMPDGNKKSNTPPTFDPLQTYTSLNIDYSNLMERWDELCTINGVDPHALPSPTIPNALKNPENKKAKIAENMSFSPPSQNTVLSNSTPQFPPNGAIQPKLEQNNELLDYQAIAAQFGPKSAIMRKYEVLTQQIQNNFMLSPLKRQRMLADLVPRRESELKQLAPEQEMWEFQNERKLKMLAAQHAADHEKNKDSTKKQEEARDLMRDFEDHEDRLYGEHPQDLFGYPDKYLKINHLLLNNTSNQHNDNQKTINTNHLIWADPDIGVVYVPYNVDFTALSHFLNDYAYISIQQHSDYQHFSGYYNDKLLQVKRNLKLAKLVRMAGVNVDDMINCIERLNASRYVYQRVFDGLSVKVGFKYEFKDGWVTIPHDWY